ncbi:MAG: hypothetical protein HYZ28_15570 [Myxococcales bacterium]|nr:hypothetical protein [Myxococcales bacterium]
MAGAIVASFGLGGAAMALLGGVAGRLAEQVGLGLAGAGLVAFSFALAARPGRPAAHSPIAREVKANS